MLTGTRQEGKVHHADEADFAELVLNSDVPVLVDFYADWCGPCHVLAPVLAELEKQYSGKVAFFRVDVDRAVELAGEHDIESLPTLLLYRNGSVVRRIVGAPRRGALVAELDGLIAGG